MQVLKSADAKLLSLHAVLQRLRGVSEIPVFTRSALRAQDAPVNRMTAFQIGS